MKPEEQILIGVRSMAATEVRKAAAEETKEILRSPEFRRGLTREVRMGGAIAILDGEDASRLYRFSPFLYYIVKAFKSLVGGE